MATGKIVRTRGDRLHPADQFYFIKDSVLRGFLISFADLIDEEHRNEIVRIYNDPELASAFRSWRAYNDLHGTWTKKKTMREIVRIPAGPVYEFLKAFFEPIYGKEWMQNRKALRHPLVRPWWLISKI